MLTFTVLFGIGPLTVLRIANAEASSRVYAENMVHKVVRGSQAVSVEASGRVVRKVKTAVVDAADTFEDAQEVGVEASGQVVRKVKTAPVDATDTLEYAQEVSVEASGHVVRKVKTAPVDAADTFENAQERVMYGYERYVYTPSEDGSAPKVLFTHLLKAGGTRIEQLLGKVMHLVRAGGKLESFVASLSPSTKPLDPSDFENEVLTGVPSETHAQYFRIGIVRNPCDYLLSMWAYQSMRTMGLLTGHGRFPRKCLTKTDPNAETTLYGRDVNLQLATEADIARFRKWVRTSSGRRMHYHTLRTFFALHHEPVGSVPSFDDGQWYGCIGDLSEAEEERILAVLANTDLSERYECLIHAESIETEVRACMIKYAGFLTDERLRADFLAKVDQVDWTRSYANPSSHGKCGDYFDNDTAAFVWKREQLVATKAGYETCCAI